MNWKEILTSVVFGAVLGSVVWYLWPFIAEFPHALMDVRSDILQERKEAREARRRAKADQGLKEKS